LYSDLNFYFGFSFFEGPLKHLSQEEDLKLLMGLTFMKKILNCIVELLKVFPPSTTPLERENFIRNVELTIPEASNLSILKKGL
jgi:hypothetical protein